MSMPLSYIGAVGVPALRTSDDIFVFLSLLYQYIRAASSSWCRSVAQVVALLSLTALVGTFSVQDMVQTFFDGELISPKQISYLMSCMCDMEHTSFCCF
jgi:hypothetical protein